MVASWYFIWWCISDETSRNIQESWPPDLYFTVCWLQTGGFSMVKNLVIGRVLSWYFTRGFTSVRPAASSFMLRLMLWAGARGQYLGHHTFCLLSQRLVDGWILYLGYWFSVTQTLTWNYVCRSLTYISWSSELALICLRIFSDFELFAYFCL